MYKNYDIHEIIEGIFSVEYKGEVIGYIERRPVEVQFEDIVAKHQQSERDEKLNRILN